MNMSADIFFKVINFILICIGSIYLFYRYGILYVISSMRFNRQKRDEQKLKYDTIMQERDDVKKLSQEQEILFHRLKKNFEIWKAKELQQNDLKKELSLRYQQEAVEKLATKIENMQQRQILQKQLPQILQEISHNMRDNFEKNSGKQKKYTDKLVAFVSERIS